MAVHDSPVDVELVATPTNPSEAETAEYDFRSVLPPETVIGESGEVEVTIVTTGNGDADAWIVPRFPHPLEKPFHAIGWIGARLYGLASLVMMLAVVAAIPIVNFYALGYLLDAEGRVARSGKFRDGFPMLGLAPRFGSIVVAFAIFLLPVALLNAAARDAAVIDPASAATGRMEAFAFLVTLLVTVHLCLSLSRGGKFSNFFRPIKNVRWLWQRWRERDYWETAERGIATFAGELRVRERFWLGIRGFAVGFAWLLVPSLILITQPPHAGGAVAFAVVGSLVLIPVVAWLPFLQARFAAEDRLGAGFELQAIRHGFRRAPLCWLLAVLVTYALALPLYLLKIAVLPGDARWLATTVFVVSIWPARLVTGWAYGQAMLREQRAHWLWRWSAWLTMLPLLGFYVFVLYFTRFAASLGRFEQMLNHAFLLPSPL